MLTFADKEKPAQGGFGVVVGAQASASKTAKSLVTGLKLVGTQIPYGLSSNFVKNSIQQCLYFIIHKGGFMIRWSVSVLTSLLLITNVQTAHASFASGQDLLTGFESFERISGGQGKPSDVAHSMRISGYIQGTIDSAISAGILCIKGKNLTLKTAQPVVAQYLQKNPSFLKKSGVEAVLMSLHPAYKCD